jgi:hypothetical protein
MSSKEQFLSPSARQVEARLLLGTSGHLNAFTTQQAIQQLEKKGLSISEYELIARRRNAAGDATFGPMHLNVGVYSERELYGASGSLIPRFRSTILDLAEKAQSICLLDPTEIEYAHRTALFWSDVSNLKVFLGTSSAISELVAEFRTARYQVIGKDTPVNLVKAVGKALDLVSTAARFDSDLVDSVIDTMEDGEFDSFAPNAFSDNE